MAMMGLVRDMIGHIAASESGRLYILTIANYANSPTEAIGSPAATTGHSPRVLHLLKSLDNLARAYPPEIYHSNIARQPTTMPYTPAQPQSHQSFLNAAYNPAFSGSSVGGAAQAQASPHTDGTGSRGSLSGPSTGEIKPPASSSRLRAASNAGVVPPGSVNASVPVASQPSGNPRAGPVAHVEDPAEDVIEIPNQMQDMYGGESVSIAPLFVETPAWLTEGTTIPLTMYRKQSDGQALKAVYQAFAAGGNYPPVKGKTRMGMRSCRDPVRARLKSWQAQARWVFNNLTALVQVPPLVFLFPWTVRRLAKAVLARGRARNRAEQVLKNNVNPSSSRIGPRRPGFLSLRTILFTERYRRSFCKSLAVRRRQWRMRRVQWIK